jgi:hypothetical protein
MTAAHNANSRALGFEAEFMMAAHATALALAAAQSNARRATARERPRFSRGRGLKSEPVCAWTMPTSAACGIAGLDRQMTSPARSPLLLSHLPNGVEVANQRNRTLRRLMI